METCKTCRWWKPFQHNNWGLCLHPKLHENLWDEQPDDAAQGNEKGHISTGPDFGCIHWDGSDAKN